MLIWLENKGVREEILFAQFLTKNLYPYVLRLIKIKKKKKRNEFSHKNSKLKKI